MDDLLHLFVIILTIVSLKKIHVYVFLLYFSSLSLSLSPHVGVCVIGFLYCSILNVKHYLCHNMKITSNLLLTFQIAFPQNRLLLVYGSILMPLWCIRPVIFSARKKYWQMSPKHLSPGSMSINPLNPKCFQALTLTFPEIISEDSSSRFQVLDGFSMLYERAKAKLLEA